MDTNFLLYSSGILGNPPSCGNCSLKRCPINRFKNDDSISQAISFIHFEPRETLFHQGKPVDGAYLVCRGLVERAYRSRTGKRQLIDFVRPGDWLMEEVLSRQRVFLTFAQVASPSLIAFINQHDFLDMIEAHPTLEARLMKRLSKHIVELWQRLSFSAFANPEQRLALTFSILKEPFPDRTVDELGLDLPLTETKLADYSGICRRSVIRYLKRLRSLELVEYERGKARILDLEKLKHMINNT